MLNLQIFLTSCQPLTNILEGLAQAPAHQHNTEAPPLTSQFFIQRGRFTVACTSHIKKHGVIANAITIKSSFSRTVLDVLLTNDGSQRERCGMTVHDQFREVSEKIALRRSVRACGQQ